MEAVFCNPYSGYEKGHVESKCGYSKRNWAVPIPVFESQEQLATFFAEQAQLDRERLHYAKGEHITSLWEADRAQLLALPKTAYEAFRMSAAVVKKYGEFRVDGTSIPLAGLVAPQSEILIQTFWDRVVIMTQEQQMVRGVPRPYTGRTAEIPWVQVFTNLLRKPRSVTHSQFIRMLPDMMRQYVGVADLSVRKERLQALIHWCDIYSLKQIEQVLERATEESTIVQLTATLGIQQTNGDIPATWTESLSPPGTLSSSALDRYDRLMGVS
jgi:hypothetical protein